MPGERTVEPAPSETEHQVAELSELRSQPLGYLIVIAIGVLFFSLTGPRTMPSIILIAGFVVLAATIYSVLKLLLLVSGLQRRLRPSHMRGIVIAGTALPVLLLALQSIGQLTVRDFLAMSGLFVVGMFYVSRFSRRAAS
jgi:hypothetical protein